MQQIGEVKFARWLGAADAATGNACFLRDSGSLPASLQHIRIVLEQGGEARAAELLQLGAFQVLLADAAVLDSEIVSRLVAQFGSDRIGIYLPAGKMPVSWALETVSNADFSCLAPSYGKAAWEVLLTDGSGTGTDVEWWLSEMFRLGASTALVAMDVQDDDLNVCAGLVERFGEKLWFTPLHRPEDDMEPWVRYGQVRQLLLPASPKYDEAECARLAAGTAPLSVSGMAEEEQAA